MILSALSLALVHAHTERVQESAPVAWALVADGRITRQDGTFLDRGESIEIGARLTLEPGSRVVVGHAGHLDRWEGPAEVAVGASAIQVRIGAATARHPHAPDGANGLFGETLAPLGRAQHLSALGLPLTPEAWARQDATDAGQLHALYRDVLAERLARAGVPPATVSQLELTDALPGDVAEQEALVGRYLDLAAATPRSTLLLEVPPTDTNGAAITRNLGGTLGDSLGGHRPHIFRFGLGLLGIRTYGWELAQTLTRAGRAVFSLVVPYANTVENIVLRSARPEDGVDGLHRLLQRAGDTETVVVGYSQGGTVVRRYVDRFGDSDGLDYAVSLATMGGVDGQGGHGVWAGRRGATVASGVASLSIVHGADPARRVYGRDLPALTPRLLTYLGGGRKGDDSALHSGSEKAPPPRSSEQVQPGTGTYGYPVPYVGALFDALYAGRFEGAWTRRGDWAFDGRAERLDGAWRLEGAQVVSGYAATPPGGGAPAP